MRSERWLDRTIKGLLLLSIMLAPFYLDSQRVIGGGGGGGGTTNGAGNNVIPKSNGTNLVASSLTDNGTNVTSTEAFVGPGSGIAFSTGTTANDTALRSSPFFIPGWDVVSGNAGGFANVNAKNLCIGNAICIGNPSGTTFAFGNGTLNDASGTIQAANVKGITAFLTSNYTNATTTFSNVTGLSFAVAASQNYKITCDLDYQTSATTADIKIQWTGPTSPTAVTYDFHADLTATTSATDSVATAFSTSLAGTGTPTITTNLPLRTTMTLINGANAGTVQLQAAATGTGTITIIPGSCVVTQ